MIHCNNKALNYGMSEHPGYSNKTDTLKAQEKSRMTEYSKIPNSVFFGIREKVLRSKGAKRVKIPYTPLYTSQSV